MNELHFGYRWGTRLSEPMTREEAFLRHQNNEPYTVVVGDIQKPECYLTVWETPGLVAFLDEKKRNWLKQEWKEINPKQLMLWIIETKEYAGESKDSVGSTKYHFSPDGRVIIYKRTGPAKGGTSASFEAQADLTDFFIQKPGFAEYDEVIRQREIKIIPGSIRPHVPPPPPVKWKETSFGTTATLYYEAKRSQPLTGEEQAEVKRITAKYAVENQIEKYLQTGEGLNWTSFDAQLNPKPGVILSGSTQLPGNTENPVAAATQGVEHWSACLAELRRAIKGANWTVTVEDAPLTWDEQRQLYDLTK